MAKGKTTPVEEVFFNDAMTDTKTLQEIFDLYDAHEESLKRLKIKNDKEVVDAQARYKKKKFLEIEETIKEAELSGVGDIANLRKKLQAEAIKEDFEKRVEEQNKLYKKEMELAKNMKKSLAQKIEEGNKKYQENDATIRFYNEILKNGGTLTIEQQQDKAAKEAEQKALNQQNVAMQVQKSLVTALQGLSDSVNQNMKTYTELQKGTNARLQGHNLGANGFFGAVLGGKRLTDTYGIIENRLTSAVGVNPYFKTESMLSNLSNLINEGIASNVEQRAFLQTASENIANTFDVANGALLRIIRLQQNDSTAARLGMEAYLTRFLNNLVDNTEYLNQTFDSVTEALVETSSHMTSEAATELEFVIQKWLGSLVGVGMSDSTATSIAQALGYLGSGNIEALNNSNLQNLLVMAASRSNLSYSGLLTEGLNAKSADVLLNNLVAYMVDIERSGNNVVKSQFANTFGVSYSDLAAAANLASSMGSIYGKNLSHQGMYNELMGQMMQIPGRMSMSTMIDNLWENLEFGLASNIASSPALAAIWKVTDLIQQNTGGINIPAIEALTAGFGGMVDLNTSVENLVKLGVVGVGSLGMVGDLISGLTTGIAPTTALWKLGIFGGSTKISRGSGLSSTSSGLSTSASTVQTVGQGSGETIKESTLNQANEETKQPSAVSPEEEEEMKKANVNIYKYLTESFDGKMDRLLSYVDELESKLRDIELKIPTW